MYKNIIHQKDIAAATRHNFDLRRNGLTVRSVVDCCIAGIAMAYDATILHNDRDFATIAKLRSLKHLQFGAPGAAGFHEPEQAPLR